MSLEVIAIRWDDPRCGPLVAEGREGDGTFLQRFAEEGRSGACRFEAPGEFLLGIVEGAELIGIGGVSLDPYCPAPGLGRVRHVYVLKAHRRRGAGRRLINAIVERARADFSVLRLRTRREEAARLYESLGFAPGDAPGETHRLLF